MTKVELKQTDKDYINSFFVNYTSIDSQQFRNAVSAIISKSDFSGDINYSYDYLKAIIEECAKTLYFYEVGKENQLNKYVNEMVNSKSGLYQEKIISAMGKHIPQDTYSSEKFLQPTSSYGKSKNEIANELYTDFKALKTMKANYNARPWYSKLFAFLTGNKEKKAISALENKIKNNPVIKDYKDFNFSADSNLKVIKSEIITAVEDAFPDDAKDKIQFEEYAFELEPSAIDDQKQKPQITIKEWEALREEQIYIDYPTHQQRYEYNKEYMIDVFMQIYDSKNKTDLRNLYVKGIHEQLNNIKEIESEALDAGKKFNENKDNYEKLSSEIKSYDNKIAEMKKNNADANEIDAYKDDVKYSSIKKEYDSIKALKDKFDNYSKELDKYENMIKIADDFHHKIEKEVLKYPCELHYPKFYKFMSDNNAYRGIEREKINATLMQYIEDFKKVFPDKFEELQNNDFDPTKKETKENFESFNNWMNDLNSTNNSKRNEDFINKIDKDFDDLDKDTQENIIDEIANEYQKENNMEIEK